MGHLFSILVPVSLAAAVSPMMFSEQLLLLGGRDGRTAARRFALGALGVVLLVVAVVMTVGAGLSLPRALRLSAGLDVTLGALLLVLAVVVHRRGERRPRPSGSESGSAPRGARAAFAFGVFSMATNVTTLPLLVVGSKDVAASGVPVLGAAVALGLLVCGASAPAVVPLVLDLLPGGRRVLEQVAGLLARHSRAIAVVVLAGAGLLFVVKGTVGL